MATETGQLLQYALEIVAISFRLIYEIVLRSKRVETEPGSWSYTVLGIGHEQAQAIIRRIQPCSGMYSFCRIQSLLADVGQNLPSHKCVYISAISSSWFTLSGPHSVLARLWRSSSAIGQASRLELPADAAVHSPHLPCLDR